jgi:hypothetical protein
VFDVYQEDISTEMGTKDKKTTSSEVTDRKLLIHGPVELRNGWHRKKRHLFLFDDSLLISNTRYIRTTSSPDYHKMHFTTHGFSLLLL